MCFVEIWSFIYPLGRFEGAGYFEKRPGTFEKSMKFTFYFWMISKVNVIFQAGGHGVVDPRTKDTMFSVFFDYFHWVMIREAWMMIPCCFQFWNISTILWVLDRVIMEMVRIPFYGGVFWPRMHLMFTLSTVCRGRWLNTIWNPLTDRQYKKWPLVKRWILLACYMVLIPYKLL